MVAVAGMKIESLSSTKCDSLPRTVVVIIDSVSSRDSVCALLIRNASGLSFGFLFWFRFLVTLAGHFSSGAKRTYQSRRLGLSQQMVYTTHTSLLTSPDISFDCSIRPTPHAYSTAIQCFFFTINCRLLSSRCVSHTTDKS